MQKAGIKFSKYVRLSLEAKESMGKYWERGLKFVRIGFLVEEEGFVRRKNGPTGVGPDPARLVNPYVLF